jgi:hypothetical protein
MCVLYKAGWQSKYGFLYTSLGYFLFFLKKNTLCLNFCLNNKRKINHLKMFTMSLLLFWAHYFIWILQKLEKWVLSSPSYRWGNQSPEKCGYPRSHHSRGGTGIWTSSIIVPLKYMELEAIIGFCLPGVSPIYYLVCHLKYTQHNCTRALKVIKQKKNTHRWHVRHKVHWNIPTEIEHRGIDKTGNSLLGPVMRPWPKTLVLSTVLPLPHDLCRGTGFVR